MVNLRELLNNMKKYFWFVLVLLLIPVWAFSQTRPNFRQITDKPYVYIGDYTTIKGDGVTDDSATIQAVIDANPGGTFLFEAKTYVVNSPIILSSRESLVGSSITPDYSAGTIMLSTEASSTALISIGEGTQQLSIKIANISFRGTGWLSDTNGISGAMAYSTIDNCFFSNLKRGIYVYSTGNTFRNLGFAKNASGALGEGLVLRLESVTSGDGANRNLITNCSFFYTLDTTNAAVTICKGNNTVIDNCWFESTGNTAISLYGGYQVTISNSYFESIARDIPAYGITGSGNILTTSTLDSVGVYRVSFQNNYVIQASGKVTNIHSGLWASSVNLSNNSFLGFSETDNISANLSVVPIGSAYNNTSAFWPMSTSVNNELLVEHRRGIMDSPWFNSASLSALGFSEILGGASTATLTADLVYSGNTLVVDFRSGDFSYVYLDLPYKYYRNKRIAARAIVSGVSNLDRVGVYAWHTDVATPSFTLAPSSNILSFSSTASETTYTGYVDLPDEAVDNLFLAVAGTNASATIHALDFWILPSDLATKVPLFLGR